MLLALMGGLMDTERAGTSAGAALAPRQDPAAPQLKRRCEQHQHDPAKQLGGSCRAMFKGWTVIIRTLYDTALPLTNTAEQQLRHWVVAREARFGTCSGRDSRALALRASITDTCRLCASSAWDYLTDAIRVGRQGLPLPPVAGHRGVNGYQRLGVISAAVASSKWYCALAPRKDWSTLRDPDLADDEAPRHQLWINAFMLARTGTARAWRYPYP